MGDIGAPSRRVEIVPERSDPPIHIPEPTVPKVPEPATT